MTEDGYFSAFSEAAAQKTSWTQVQEKQGDLAFRILRLNCKFSLQML